MPTSPVTSRAPARILRATRDQFLRDARIATAVLVVPGIEAHAITGACASVVEVGNDRRCRARPRRWAQKGPRPLQRRRRRLPLTSFDVAAGLAAACGALPPMIPAITRPTADPERAHVDRAAQGKAEAATRGPEQADAAAAEAAHGQVEEQDGDADQRTDVIRGRCPPYAAPTASSDKLHQMMRRPESAPAAAASCPETASAPSRPDRNAIGSR